MWGTSKYMGVSTHIQGISQHRGASYVWMPPVHTQHKESMLCQTKGMSICPIHLDVPIPLDTHIYLNAPCMFGCSCMLGCPLCLDAPHMLGHPICLDAPLCLDDVWMPPVHIQYKESMLYQMKVVSICPHTCVFPLYINNTKKVFGCPLYIHNTKKACFVR